MSRLLVLNTAEGTDGSCVMYVMSRDQRVHDNHALLAAQQAALTYKVPLVVVFNVLKKSGVRSREHFTFMIVGLKQVEQELASKNISFVLTHGNAYAEILKVCKQLEPREVYFDFSSLKGSRQLQKKLAASLKCRVVVCDAHNIVPTWVLSDKEEYAAHTIRSKIHKQLTSWLQEYEVLKEHPHTLDTQVVSVDWKQVETHIQTVPESGVQISYDSGEAAAKQALQTFIKAKLKNYVIDRNNPTVDGQSGLSPYLHYGQLSALRIVLEVMQLAKTPPLLLREPKLASHEGEPTLAASIDAFLEELIVRRELADNYCFYNPHYTSLEGAKDWAQQTLKAHLSDPREYVYSREELKAATTHDPAWNAAQKQLHATGKMHGYMRMYWAKKIMEWSVSPQEAIDSAVYLNDHYSIDGGDPNGYVGIMWSIAGVHDRPWFERSVFGKIRYMNSAGLTRKFDLKAYTNKWLKT